MFFLLALTGVIWLSQSLRFVDMIVNKGLSAGYFLYLSSMVLPSVLSIILPIAVGYGIHPVHLGIIFLANMQLGYFTPPVGMNLFIASFRFQKPVMTLYRATIPFFLVLLIAVLIITYWPALSLVLLS